MAQPLRILIVEDSESDAKLAEHELRRGGFDVQAQVVSTAAELSAALGSTLWDVILCDHSLPTLDSAAALRIAKARQPDVPFIIVSGSLPEAAAAQAMLLGAQDYLSKDNLARLVPAVKRELADAAERRTLRLGAAESVKRTRLLPAERRINWYADTAEGLDAIRDTVEFKTTWHPIGA